MDVAHRYLELGLRLGRHVDGLVDAYYGPAEIKERTDAEELVPPDRLRADAEELRSALAGAGYEEQRRAWLDDQLRGVETYARLLAGEALAYAEEVEGCFGVRPERMPESVFEAAHARLAEILPGEGSLLERMEAWRAATTVPAERVEAAYHAVSALLHEATLRRFGLPDGENVEVEIVQDEPWLAYNYYLGGLRSRVAINVDQPITAGVLTDLVAHEAYPGHHTERVLKEVALVGSGVVEETLVLVPTPQSLLSEGIAENAWDALVDDELLAQVGEALAAAGVEVDLERAEAIGVVYRDLRFVGANVALLVHEEGASREEAVDYLERWTPSTRERAEQAVRFVLDPLWRGYAANYATGGALVRRWLDGDPSRFHRLLTEQVRVDDLLAVSSRP